MKVIAINLSSIITKATFNSLIIIINTFSRDFARKVY